MQKEEFEYYILPSGIKCILKRVKSKVAYCSLTIGTGSRDEAATEHGMAHLIEHTMFKGTVKRNSYHINTLLDNVGGDMNAYTTKEETVIHTVSLKEDIRKAIDLISDVAFNSKYSQKDIDKEVNIIIDEINSYKDSPAELIYDEFEELLFKGSSLGRSILGTKRGLKKLKSDDVKRFVAKNYNTDRMVFAIIGDITKSRFIDLCDSYFGNVPKNISSLMRDTPPMLPPQNITINKRTYQAHVIIGGRAYNFMSAKRVATVLALNILGGPSANSRLNLLLREKYALTYNVEANYSAYCDSGLVSVYFSCDEESIEKARTLLFNEIKSMQNEPLSPTQLKRAKKQLIGQLSIGAESSESYMLSAAKSYLLYGSVDTPAHINEVINGVTSDDIMSVMREIFAEDNISSLIYI